MRKKLQTNDGIGCEWEIVKQTQNRRARFCHKLVVAQTIYCPKHLLMHEERDADNKRRMERVRKGKERKRAMRQALEESPLRVPIQ